jgi:hypothetical protein
MPVLTGTYPATFSDANNVVTRWGGLLSFTNGANAPGYGAPQVYSYAFTYQTAGLTTGVTLYTPAVGDLILDAGVVITTAFNGTTPEIDVGSFTGNTGLFEQLAGDAVDGSKVYADVTDNTGVAVANNPLWLSSAVISVGSAGTAAINSWQARISAANPLKFVCTQTGQKGGGAIGGTAGAATIVIVAVSPNVLA